MGVYQLKAELNAIVIAIVYCNSSVLRERCYTVTRSIPFSVLRGVIAAKARLSPKFALVYNYQILSPCPLRRIIYNRVEVRTGKDDAIALPGLTFRVLRERKKPAQRRLEQEQSSS